MNWMSLNDIARVKYGWFATIHSRLKDVAECFFKNIYEKMYTSLDYVHISQINLRFGDVFDLMILTIMKWSLLFAFIAQLHLVCNEGIFFNINIFMSDLLCYEENCSCWTAMDSGFMIWYAFIQFSGIQCWFQCQKCKCQQAHSLRRRIKSNPNISGFIVNAIDSQHISCTGFPAKATRQDKLMTLSRYLFFFCNSLSRIQTVRPINGPVHFVV